MCAEQSWRWLAANSTGAKGKHAKLRQAEEGGRATRGEGRVNVKSQSQFQSKKQAKMVENRKNIVWHNKF